MKVGPMRDRLLLRRIEEEEKTAGALIIPDTANGKHVEGKVIAVGTGKVDEYFRQGASGAGPRPAVQ